MKLQGNEIHIISFHFISEKNENIKLNFGDKVELGSVPKLYLHVQNRTAITARYPMGMENFFSKPPTPPDVSRDDVGRPSR